MQKMSNYNHFHINCYLKVTCNILFHFYSLLMLCLGGQVEEYLAFNENLNMWRCLMCLREFSQKHNATRHFRLVHCTNERQQCKFCFIWRKNKVSLDQHVREVHRKGLIMAQSQTYQSN